MRKMIKYQKGYKYQLSEDYCIQTDVRGFMIDRRFILLLPDGYLRVRHGYAWDGASGPTWDTKSTMRGSLVHDVGYQLMRECLLPNKYRPYFDTLFHIILQQDGMNRIRAWIWYKAVSTFAGTKVLAENDRPILEAP
jgi:hypothetical protein